MKSLLVRFNSEFVNEGKEGSACAEGLGEAPSFSERAQRSKTSKADAPVHASLSSRSRPDAGPASQAVSRGQPEVHVLRVQQPLGVLVPSGHPREKVNCQCSFQFFCFLLHIRTYLSFHTFSVKHGTFLDGAL